MIRLPLVVASGFRLHAAFLLAQAKPLNHAQGSVPLGPLR